MASIKQNELHIEELNGKIDKLGGYIADVEREFNEKQSNVQLLEKEVAEGRKYGIELEEELHQVNKEIGEARLLLDLLVCMHENRTDDKNALVEICKNEYETGQAQLDILKEFECNYTSEYALWWYTRESFLYRTLNNAFRTQNIDTLFAFRKIIRDIQHQLTQLQREQTSLHICVFRAQLMSFDEVDRLRNSIGELISMNSFLSTSTDRAYADFLLDSTESDDTRAHVVFYIEADPSVTTAKPVADISSHSHFPNEREVLFMAGCVFRLVDIGQEENGAHIIHLTLASDDDHDLKALLASKKAEFNTTRNLFSLGVLLTEMGQLNAAEKYFFQYMKELPDDNDSAHAADCYQELGNIFHDQGKYELSFSMYNKALVIRERALSPTDSRIAATHLGMGLVYLKMNNFEQALTSFKTALDIFKQCYGEDHERVAWCLNNISSVYREEKKYDEALRSHQRALAILEKVLPVNHQFIGISHYNIGLVHARIGQFDLATRYFETALLIGLKCVPTDNPKYVMAYKNIGFEEWTDHQQALACNQKMLFILSKSLRSIHPDFISEINRTIEHLRAR